MTWSEIWTTAWQLLDWYSIYLFIMKHSADHLHLLVAGDVQWRPWQDGCGCVQGMLRSRGRRLLFADADGATKFTDIEKLEAELAKLELASQAGDTVS